MSRRTANRKLTQNCTLTITKALTKTTIVLLEPKSGGTRPKKFFSGAKPWIGASHFRSEPVPPLSNSFRRHWLWLHLFSLFLIRLRNDLYCVEWGVKLYSLGGYFHRRRQLCVLGAATNPSPTLSSLPFFSPPLPSSSLLFPSPIPSEVGPLKSARMSGVAL